MARNLDEPGANFNQLLELSIRLQNARTFAGTKVAYNWQEGDWTAPDDESVGYTKILEDFEITDEMRRKPNAAGGRVGYQEGKTVLPKAEPEKVVLKNKMEDFERSVNLAVMGIRGGIDKDIMVDMLQKKQNEIGVSNTDAKNIIQNFMQRLSRGLKSKGGRVGLAEGDTPSQAWMRNNFFESGYDDKGVITLDDYINGGQGWRDYMEYGPGKS